MINHGGHLSEAHKAAIREGHARAKAGEGFIYLATWGDNLKIGHALNPQRRVGEWRGLILKLVRGGRCREQEIHQALKGHAVWGRERYPRSIVNHPAFPQDLIPLSGARDWLLIASEATWLPT